MPRPPCRNGRRPGACRRRNTSKLRASGPDHAPVFTIAARLDTGQMQSATAGSKRAGRTGRRQGAAGQIGARHHDHPRRICRPDRRAQRGQIHAAEPHGGGQGVDRDPQGADHPRPHSRRRDGGRGTDRLCRHAGPVPATPPAGPGHGRRRLGRGGGRRCRGVAGRGASRRHRRGGADP